MKLEQLTKKIQSLVPEVLENPFTAIVRAGEEDLKECDDMDGVRELTGQIERAREMEATFEGIEIQLSHILMALEKVTENKEEIYVVSHYGNFYEIDPNVSVAEDFYDYPILGNWDLTKPLSGQTAETLNFLADIFCLETVVVPTLEQSADPIEMVIWDLETTGFVAPECRVLEIGAIVLREGKEPEHRHWVINENIEIPEKITEITGITREIVQAEGRDVRECLDEFLPLLIAAKKNVTHNGIRFDIPFLTNYAMDVLGWDDFMRRQFEDSLRKTSFDTAVHFKASKLGLKQRENESFVDYASRVMEIRAFGVKYNLALCCEEAKVDLTGITFHRALGDVAMTYELYKYIHA